MTKYKTTTIRLKESDYNILKDDAEKEKRSVNYIINEILTQYIKFGVAIDHRDIKIDNIDIDFDTVDNF